MKTSLKKCGCNACKAARKSTSTQNRNAKKRACNKKIRKQNKNLQKKLINPEYQIFPIHMGVSDYWA